MRKSDWLDTLIAFTSVIAFVVAMAVMAKMGGFR